MASLNTQEYTQRVGLAPDNATVRGLIFNAVFKLVEQKLGEASATELRAQIAKKPLVDFFSYPARDFLKVLFDAGERLAPLYGSSQAAIRACGAAAVGGFFLSGVGRTLTTIIGMGEPKKLFANAPTAYSTAVSYGQRKFNVLGERRVSLHFKGDMQPVEFHQGMFEAALEGVGCPGKVDVRRIGLDEAEYLIEW
ncbi:MAG: TIGR02265 family protein [Cystobacter sp.]